MAYNHEYPYIDAQVGNADWVINKVKELDARVTSELKSEIREQLNDLFIDSMYIPETETLALTLTLEE